MSEPRPYIWALGNEEINYATQNHAIWISDTPIAEVVLIALGSMTHSIDMNQRYVQLHSINIPIEGTNYGYIIFNGPENSRVAPAGDYMLFVLDENRVPSLAMMVHLN